MRPSLVIQYTDHLGMQIVVVLVFRKQVQVEYILVYFNIILLVVRIS